MPGIKVILHSRYGCHRGVGGSVLLPSPTPVFGFIFPLLRHEQHLGDLQCSFFKSRPEKVNEMAEACHRHMLKWKEQLQARFLCRSLSAGLTFD